MTVKEIPLQRLLPAEAESFLAAFSDLLPGNAAAIFDTQGQCLIRVGRGELPFKTLPGPALTWLAEAVGNQANQLDGAVFYPLRLGGRRLGCLVVKAIAPEAEVLQTSLALMIKSTAEKRMLARETLDRYHELNLLYHLAERLATSLDEDEIFNIVIAEARRVIPAVCGVLLLRESSEHQIRQRAAFGNFDDIQAVELLLQGLVQQKLALKTADILANLSSSDGSIDLILYAPLAFRDSFHGLVALGRYANQPEFTASDMKLLLALVSHAMIAVEQSWLHQKQLQHQRIEQELLIGQRIQRSLMPKSMPEIPGWELAVRYQAASQVGGDFYDIFSIPCEIACLDSQCYGITIADVTGKGIPAALMMAFTKGILHSAALAQPSPAKVLLQSNEAILQTSYSGLLLTVFYGRLDPCTGLLRYANAGHDPPFHYQAASRKIQKLTGGRNLIMGAFSEQSFTEAEIQLQPGDALFFFTDGVTEARNIAGDFFPEERLLAGIADLKNISSAEVLENILKMIAEFTSGGQQADDITMLLLRWSGSEPLVE